MRYAGFSQILDAPAGFRLSSLSQCGAQILGFNRRDSRRAFDVPKKTEPYFKALATLKRQKAINALPDHPPTIH